MKLFRVPYARCRHSPKQPIGSPLRVEGLSYRYPSQERDALSEVSLEVKPGKSLALLGPNGSGKSTLLKAITGILPQNVGAIHIFESPLATCHHWVSYLPQRSELDWDFPIDVRHLVLAGRYVHRGWFSKPTLEDRKRVDAALESFHLGDLAARPIGQLSGGQQQRALLARALVQEAPLILLDEPLNAVDNITREVVYDVLIRLREAGQSFVMATHDFRRVHELFDDVIFLENGRISPIPKSVESEIHALSKTPTGDARNPAS